MHTPETTAAKRERIELEDAGTLEEREFRTDEMYMAFRADQDQYPIRRQALIDDFKRDLDALCPVLKVPSSPEECLAAAETLNAGYLDLVEQMKKPRADLRAEAHSLVEREFNMSDMYDRLEQCYPSKEPEDELLRDKRLELRVWHRGHCHEKIKKDLKELEAAGSHDEINFQLQMHKMLEGQSPEAKDLVLVHNNAFTEIFAKTSKPTFVSLSPSVNLLGNTNGIVPAEIATMIYSHCDLETAVALREVNQRFYMAFNSGYNEAIFRTKVLDRFPWTQLEEGEMSTWADYTLVFMKRISGGRWKWTSSLKNLKEFQHREPIIKPLICQTIKSEEELPDTFQKFESLPAVNQKTYSKFTVLRDKHGEGNEYDVLVESENIKITLPSKARVRSVSIRKGTIVVDTKGKKKNNYLFPPGVTNYLEAIEFEPCDKVFQVSDNICGIEEQTTVERHLEFHFKDRHYEGGRTLIVEAYSSMDPAASYNGLVWWLSQPCYLIPTFVDFKTPKRIYFREDKIIWLDSKNPLYYSISRCREDIRHFGITPHGQGGGGNRFVAAASTFGTVIADLATLTLRNVQGINIEKRDARKGEFVVGYSQGKFDIRYNESADRHMGPLYRLVLNSTPRQEQN